MSADFNAYSIDSTSFLAPPHTPSNTSRVRPAYLESWSEWATGLVTWKKSSDCLSLPQLPSGLHQRLHLLRLQGSRGHYSLTFPVASFCPTVPNPLTLPHAAAAAAAGRWIARTSSLPESAADSTERKEEGGGGSGSGMAVPDTTSGRNGREGPTSSRVVRRRLRSAVVKGRTTCFSLSRAAEPLLPDRHLPAL